MKSTKKDDNLALEDLGITEDDLDPKKYEALLLENMSNFKIYIASIINDLEQKEIQENTRVIEDGKKRKLKDSEIDSMLNNKWTGALSKINLFHTLLCSLLSTDRLVKYFIVVILPMKKWIVDRQVKFFLKAEIFPMVPEQHVSFFRNLWYAGIMTDTEIDEVWQYWDNMIEIAEDWQAVTGWEYDPSEKMFVPNVDYEKAAKEAGIV